MDYFAILFGIEEIDTFATKTKFVFEGELRLQYAQCTTVII